MLGVKFMAVTTLELRKAIDSLKIALDLYKSSLHQDIEIQKAFRDACIQRFEYSIELSWKVAMKLLGSATAAAKPAIREMARNNLINNPERWIEFIEHRNNTPESYDEDAAQTVLKATTEFFVEASSLINKLEQFQ